MLCFQLATVPPSQPLRDESPTPAYLLCLHKVSLYFILSLAFSQKAGNEKLLFSHLADASNPGDLTLGLRYGRNGAGEAEPRMSRSRTWRGRLRKQRD